MADRLSRLKSSLQSKLKSVAPLTDADLRGLLQELEAYRLELEMQNEALLQARSESETSGELLLLFIEHAPAALAMFDRDMCYLAASPRWIDDYGLDGQHLIGHTHYEVFPEISEHLKELHRRGMAGEAIRSDGDRIERANGSVQWIKWEMMPWFAADGSVGGIVIFSEDITRQKNLEEEVRRLADVSLRESAERYRLVVEHVAGAVLAADPEGHFIYANGKAADMFGYSARELIGKSIADITPADELEHAMQLFADLKQRGTLQTEVRLRHRDGNIMTVEANAIELPDGTFLATLRDISALKRSAKEIEDLYAHAPCGYHSLDSEGVFVRMNDTELGWLGYTRDEVIGKLRFQDIVTPAGAERFEKGFASFKKQGCIENAEYDLVRKDGAIIHVLVNANAIYDDAGRFVMSRGSVLNITERKLARHKLHQSEEKYRKLMHSAKDAIFVADAETGMLIDANPSAEQLIGYPLKDFVGKHQSMLHPPAEAERYADLFRRHIASGGGLVTEPTYVQHRNGRKILVEISSALCEFGGKRIVQGIFRDMSRRTQNEMRIRLLNKMYLVMSRASQASHACKGETELFEQICRIAVEAGGVKMAWIGKADETDAQIRPVASYGAGTGYLDRLTISLHPDHPHGNGPTAIAYREGRAVTVQDFSSDPLTAPFCKLAKPYGWGASATYPVLRHGKAYAVITLYYAEKNPFSAESIGVMNEMAENIVRGLDRLDLEAEKQQAEESMRLAMTIYESSSEGIMVTDEHNNIIDANPAFTAISGYTLEEVRGKNPRIFKSGKHDKAFYQQMWQSIHEHGHWQGEIWDRRKDGSLHAKWLNINAIRNADGSIYRHVAEFLDITETKFKDELIWNQANLDTLTNLPNRRLLTDRIQQAMATGARSGRHGALIALDLDHFKRLNDTKGHSVGDALLIEVAQRLKASVREGDSIARMGGDEFIIVLIGLSHDQSKAAAQAEQIAAKIRSQLSEPYALGDFEYYTTPSIGIALFRGHAESQDTLLAHVDTAMYQAKARGRNAICFFDASMQEELENRTRLEHALRLALADQQLVLHYQLQVDNHGRAIGVEALIRWQHPELGIIPPAQFIPLAEESGLILPIGQWVLDAACAQLADWQSDPHLRSLSIAINASARQFRESTFVDQVRDAVERYAIRPELLKLELTESLVLENFDDARNKIHELKELGIMLSLDDFGTGYSSLSYLSRMRFDQLKIDQSFVRNMVSDIHDAAIVQTIISMADNLGIDVIAEGVETDEQLAFLKRHGCKAYQGYLFAAAAPGEALERDLRDASFGPTPA
jgi:diguanylate cyclase (GGDEF)-like protein/PAS domain S-box-containing protein